MEVRDVSGDPRGVRDWLGDPRGGLGRVGGISVRSRMGRGIHGEVKDW